MRRALLCALLVSTFLLDSEDLLLRAKSFKVFLGHLPLCLRKTLIVELLVGALACPLPIHFAAKNVSEAEAAWSDFDLVLAAEISELLLIPVSERDCVINLTTCEAFEDLGTLCGTVLSDMSGTLACEASSHISSCEAREFTVFSIVVSASALRTASCCCSGCSCGAWGFLFYVQGILWCLTAERRRGLNLRR